LTFSVGYFEGQKHSKVSIASKKAMYQNYPVGEITLPSGVMQDVKRKRVESSYHGEEEEVDKIYMELRESMISQGCGYGQGCLHESTDEPPKY
jgi:hypothetical protein